MNVRLRDLYIVVLFGFACGARGTENTAQPPRGPDAAPWHKMNPPRTPAYTQGATKRSIYIPGADGTRLALDYYLPEGLPEGTRLPAILQQTRYWRSSILTDEGMKSCRTIPEDFSYFTNRGYAVVIVDVRGTGASFGTRTTELSDAEIADAAAIADWIVAQPWSSGRIGTTGISYVGMLAELTLLNRHPAFKAALPLFPVFDPYADLYFPGGIRNHLHLEDWGFVTGEMDKAPPGKVTSYRQVVGPCPVDGDDEGQLLATARAEHQGNSNRTDELRGAEFRDDARMPGKNWSGAYWRQGEIDRANVPVLVIAGWHDAALADGAINRFLTSVSPQKQLILAPNSHGGDHYYGPGVQDVTLSSFDIKAEMLRFFDRHLRDRERETNSSPRLRWFATGANVWREADSWPKPSSIQRLCLGEGSTLGVSACDAAPDSLELKPLDVQSTGNSRWHTTMGKPIVYGDRSKVDRRLPKFQTEPLADNVEIVGSPVLSLTFRTSGEDADVLIYLEEVDPSGRAFYVTEGMLRASHAMPGKLRYTSLGLPRSDLRADRQPVRDRDLQLAIRLFPVGHRFRAGNSIRLVVAGSDVAVFDTATCTRDAWTIGTGGPDGSALSLPVFR